MFGLNERRGEAKIKGSTQRELREKREGGEERKEVQQKRSGARTTARGKGGVYLATQTQSGEREMNRTSSALLGEK